MCVNLFQQLELLCGPAGVAIRLCFKNGDHGGDHAAYKLQQQMD